MVVTDGSEAADRVLDVAAAIIKAVSGELSILTVGE
jgi:nucleotide-binding universal stress UspA family protein